MSDNKRIFFFTDRLLKTFSHSLSSRYILKHNKFTFNGVDGELVTCDGLKSKNMDMILFSHHSNVSPTQIRTLISLLRPDDIVVLCLYSYLNEPPQYLFKENIQKITKLSNVVFVDQEGESYPNEMDFDYEYQKLINTSNSIYILSNRAFGNGERISSRNYILNLCHYFNHLSDNINIHPQIPYNESTEKDYDYISYLGLRNNEGGREWRQEILNLIDFHDKTLTTPRSFDNLNGIQREIKKSYSFPEGNLGSYVMFSILESQRCKAKIVFETEYPEDYDLNKIYFTEKTLKCLIYEQPYFLFLNKKLKKELVKYGFILPEPESINEMIKYISNVNEEGLDEWIEENRYMFEHNKRRFYELMFSSELPYYKQLVEWKLI